jgi:hypothetical protein
LARQHDPDWDGTYVTVVSPRDTHPGLFVVIELLGCADIRFGGPMTRRSRGIHCTAEGWRRTARTR